ncbi:MAG TPA: MarR family transcriptional regulator [Acidothermaceae bacterium]|jgi:DNA-binding MarR family transcriptional regulator
MTRPTTTISTDAETAARLRLVISRLARAVRQHGAAGLTPSQVSALATIEEFGPLRMSDLAGYELIGAPVATRVVSSLQELGLVQKAHGSTDGRVSLIELSDAGRETLNELWSERAAGLTARIERLNPDQITVLTAALPVLETLVRDRVID